VTVRREQREQLESNHRENRAIGVGRQGQAQLSEEKKWRYSCMLLGTSSFKEGAMWHVDPLLGNGRETNDRGL
jgi:hypothetical protein